MSGHHDPSHEQRLWLTEEAAEFARVSTRTLQRKRAEGEGPPFIRLGRFVRYLPADVRQWVEQNRVGA